MIKAAFYTMVAGEAGAVAAAITGAIDYFNKLVPGTAPFRVATWHALLNVSVFVLYGFNLGLRLGSVLEVTKTPLAPLLLSLLGVVLLIASSYLGGQLVYHYGIGVRLTTGQH